MKLSLIAGCALLASQQAVAFHVAPILRTPSTTLNMFSGAGAGAPKEDNPEEAKRIEETARAMNMSVEEYTLAMNARVKLQELMDNTIVKGGKADTVMVERDLNNPSKQFEIKITDAGKALGKEGLSKQLCAALKKASDEARIGRGNAQKKMMEYISEQMKK